MNSIQIPAIQEVGGKLSLAEITLEINKMDRHILGNVPWLNYAYKPLVDFTLAHNKNTIFLQYRVEEKEIRAVNNKINDPVYEDTCVEFFISFDNTGYYNFEFNCIGTCLVGFGKHKHNRVAISETAIKEIKCQANIATETDLIKWVLTIEIPVSVFTNHTIWSLSGLQAKANFYKCGDLLADPHFLSWSNIESAEPNFHLPEFFGDIRFI